MLLRPAIAAAVLFALAVLPAQDAKRWIDELGDPQRSEAAEISLAALGAKAVEPLQQFLVEAEAKTARERDRIQALLRVVELLGPAAAPLAAELTTLCKQDLGPAAAAGIETLASLAPYGKGGEWHELFHHGAHEADDAVKAALFAAFVRFSQRSGRGQELDFEACRRLLGDDEIFTRELAAENFARLGDPSGFDLLHERLLHRDQPPKGHDGLRHNGFVVPMSDRFVPRASDAMIALRPDDPRCAVAWGCRAATHPHRPARLAALQALARFGPDAAAATPEIVAIANGGDEGLAKEALKVLGMVGAAAGPHLATFEALAQRPGDVGRLAKGLVARLQAAGVKLTPVPAAAAPRADLVAAVQTLADTASPAIDAAAQVLLAAADAAWAPALARFRKDPKQAPDRLVRLLGRLGRGRPDADRDSLRYALASLNHDNWHAPMMAMYSGGDALRAVHAEVYGELVVDPAASLDAMQGWLDHKCVAVQWAAATALAARPQEVAAASPAAAGVRAALQALVAEAIKTSSPFQIAPNDDHDTQCDLTGPIRTAAALALVASELPGELQRTLLPLALAGSDEARVVAAIQKFGVAADEKDLERASKDARATVAAAAKAALAARSAAGK